MFGMKHSWTQRLLFGCMAFLIAAAAFGQHFESGSTGVDGALTFENPDPFLLEILFDPATHIPPLDVDGDNIYHFTTITIPANVKVKLSARILGTKPVVWLAQGDVNIEGILDLSGETGNAGNEPRLPARGGAGGYDGGPGGTALEIGQAGSGPGGGGVGGGTGSDKAGGSGAGHSTVGGGSQGGIQYGNSFLLPLIGGSGGGAAIGHGGGGGGGGALIAATSGTINAQGSILANGGMGGNGLGTAGGGGGSGGSIKLMANRIAGGGSLNSNGGTGGSGIGDHFGGNGATGRIRIESFMDEFSGTISPLPIRSTPGVIFPPSNYPTLKATTVAGIAVPDDPKDDPTDPDITINSTTTAALILAATRIPTGTNVRVRIVSEELAQQIIQIPLAGTFLSSTGSANVNFPPGLSRVYLYASWDVPVKDAPEFSLKEFPGDPITSVDLANDETLGGGIIRFHLDSGTTVEIPSP